MSISQSTSIDDCDNLTTASPPFDDPKADVIIRSTDNIHFYYVHKSLLSIVSPVFKGMFTLPDDASQERVYDDRPCLPVSDDSRHLFCLLSWCDPRCKRSPPTLDNLVMTLEIADKYEMKSIFAHAQKDLLASDFVESEPLTTFAIAIRF
jgi:BTB/POZ domain